MMQQGTAVIALVDTGTVDAAEALRRSLAPYVDESDLYVLGSPRVQVEYPQLNLIPAAEFNDTQLLVSEVLSETDLCAFALPRAIEHLLKSYQSCVFLGPGLLLVGSPEPLVAVADRAGVGLFRPNAPWQPTSLQPRVKALESLSAQIETRVVALTGGSLDFLSDWKDVTREAVLDVKQRSVTWASSSFLATALGRSEVSVGGSQVTRVIDFGTGQWEPHTDPPCVVTCDELFAVVRLTENEEEYELRWQAATAKVDDTDVMDGVLANIQETARLFNKDRLPTSFDEIRTEVRRAMDPFGRTWGVRADNEFTDWLYQSNSNGLTRIANLVIMDDVELFRRFADARYDSSEFREWVASEGTYRLGFDPFDPELDPFHPPLEEDSNGDKKHANPLLWRWNVIKSLTPGYSRRLWYQEQQKLVGRPSPREGQLVVPQLVPVDAPSSHWGDSPRSLNIVGLFRSESGLGQAARATLGAVRLLGRPFSHIDTSEMYPSRNSVSTGLTWDTYGQAGDVNLIHANADELITMRDTAFKHRLGAQFNIGIWFWETADLPERSRGAFASMDELWVASRYLQNVFGQYGRVPVRHVGLAADLPKERQVDRQGLGWRDDELVFLFAYDALSSHGRKNPSAAIRAFKRAFAPGFDNVRLVIKASNLGKFVSAKREIETLIEGCDSIQLIDRYLAREQVLDLMAASDVYVSLHAAEGFGLTILEAMALGTPAVCTGYSGNMDFTTPVNSWLVGYDLMKTEEPTGPYPTGSVWASPRVEEAVEVMRQIKEHPETIRDKGDLARKDAVEAASLERYAQRLDEQLRRVL